MMENEELIKDGSLASIGPWSPTRWEPNKGHKPSFGLTSITD